MQVINATFTKTRQVIICKSDRLKSLICSDVITKLEGRIINIKQINNDLEAAHPLSDTSCT